MPNKRKRNAGDAPVAKRKVGAALKRTAAQESPQPASPAAEPAFSPDDAPTADAGATQPLEPAAAAEKGAPIPAAHVARPKPKAHAASADDGKADSEAAPLPGEDADLQEGPSSAPAADEPPRPHVKVIGAAAQEEPPAKGDGSGSKKMTKRKSTRSERRRDRKKAKADKRAQMSPARRTLRIVRTLVIAFAVLAVIAGGAAAAGISYHRWYAYDDALEIQGTWYVSGTDTPIEITADTIVLADDVAYKYKLDPSSKTITFSFGNLRGQGHYRFSLDRQYLVIFDGEYTWEQSLSTDVAWLIQALKDQFFDAPNDLAQGAFYNVTLLSRSSADNSAVSASVVATSEGPRVVWSAPDAEGGSGDAGGAPDASASSGNSDVDSLLGNLSDLPAD